MHSSKSWPLVWLYCESRHAISVVLVLVAGPSLLHLSTHGEPAAVLRPCTKGSGLSKIDARTGASIFGTRGLESPSRVMVSTMDGNEELLPSVTPKTGSVDQPLIANPISKTHRRSKGKEVQTKTQLCRGKLLFQCAVPRQASWTDHQVGRSVGERDAGRSGCSNVCCVKCLMLDSAHLCGLCLAQRLELVEERLVEDQS